MKKYLQVIEDETGIHLKVSADKATAIAMMVLLSLHISRQTGMSVRELSGIIAATAEKL